MMIKQLSVFLENKSGRLNEVLDILGQADIRIIAATVADTSEYGILRLITSDTASAYEVLKEHRVSAQQSDVVALTCNSKAGVFASQINSFAKEGLSIEYMYCFSIRDKAFLILRTSDNARVDEIAQYYGLSIITEQELLQL
jgi:hypothetical protein